MVELRPLSRQSKKVSHSTGVACARKISIAACKISALNWRSRSSAGSAALRSAELTRAAAEQELAALIGVRNLRIDAQGDLLVALPDFSSPQERERLLLRSSLMESARAEIVKNQFLLRRAEVEPIPNVILSSGYQWTVNEPHSQALLGVYFTMPVWDRNQGNIRAAAAGVRQSRAQLTTVQNDLLRQLAEALGRYRAAQQTVENYEKGILPDAKRTLELVQKLYEAGQVDLVKLLQTQRSVFETNLEYVAALQDRLVAGAAVAGLLQLDQFP